MRRADIARNACCNLALKSGNQTIIPILEKSGDWIGRYKLLQQIGEGGCGIVYMAEQDEPVRRRVALKIIKLGMDTKSVIARFEAERQALAMMDHPNIAKVFDAGATDTGRPYFVMELVRGIKITDYCDAQKLSIRQRLDLFIQVCQAIQHAHQKGIIHRDIKPSNVLVTEHDGAAVPKIIDFGIAKATTGQRLTDKTLFTAFEQFIGTPAYMSPEQAGLGGLDIDTRSDIYSLGVLLYELLTGHQPFDSAELHRAALDEVLRTLREKEPPRPSAKLTTLTEQELTLAAERHQTAPAKLSSLLRGDLDWIVMKALDKDRRRRYDTANGFAADIQRHLNNEPVTARSPSNLYRFQKMVRRNKLAFAAASAVFLTLAVGLGVSTWLYVQERRAHQREIAAENAQRQLQEEAAAARQLENSAHGFWSGGRLAEAEANYRQLVVIQKKLLGDIHPDVAASLHNLYLVFQSEGKTNEAKKAWNEVLVMQKKLGVQSDSKTFFLLNQEHELQMTQTSLVSAIKEQTNQPDPVLIGLWKCDGNGKDSVGTNNGVLDGDVMATNGVKGLALHFDGVDGAVQISNAPMPRTLSVAAWVCFDNMNSRTLPGLQYLVFRKNSRVNNFEAFTLGKDQNNSVDRLFFAMTSADGYDSSIYSTNGIVTGVFYHVVGTFDGKWARFYVNGKEQGAAYHPFPVDYGSRPMFFGTSGEPWDGRFAGTLDEVSLYDGALSPAQIAALHEAGTLGQ